METSRKTLTFMEDIRNSKKNTIELSRKIHIGP